MRKLSFKEFEKNNSYIYRCCKDDSRKLYAWLKQNDYSLLNRDLEVDVKNFRFNDLICHNGFGDLKQILNEDWMNNDRNDIYTVDQLEFKRKMTVAEIVDVLGYDIEIIK